MTSNDTSQLPNGHLDDTGFTATGDVRAGVLYHEHLVLNRAD
jgi:hypothetical protein